LRKAPVRAGPERSVVRRQMQAQRGKGNGRAAPAICLW